MILSARPTDPSAPRSERLQKILAAAGLASRRHAERWICEGRVRINGRVAGLGDTADPHHDRITLDDVDIIAEPLRYWLLHKPAGVLTSVRDPHGRPTVMDLVPERGARVVPVGRLDLDTEGLVLLTNDGETANALLHPRYGCEREYVVTVRGIPTRETLRRLAQGVELDDGPTSPARVGAVQCSPTRTAATFHLVLREGRKRQIRRSLAALGHRVTRLVRIRMGPLELGALPPGVARPLGEAERQQLLDHAARLREGACPEREDAENSPAAAPITHRAARQGSARSGGSGAVVRGRGRTVGGRDRVREATERVEREPEPEDEGGGAQ